MRSPCTRTNNNPPRPTEDKGSHSAGYGSAAWADKPSDRFAAGFPCCKEPPPCSDRLTIPGIRRFSLPLHPDRSPEPDRPGFARPRSVPSGMPARPGAALPLPSPARHVMPDRLNCICFPRNPPCRFRFGPLPTERERRSWTFLHLPGGGKRNQRHSNRKLHLPPARRYDPAADQGMTQSPCMPCQGSSPPAPLPRGTSSGSLPYTVCPLHLPL